MARKLGDVKPRLLDLFCGAGGCTKGYQRAGFYVVGVDINPQPNYCGDEFHQGDASNLGALCSGDCLTGNCWACVDGDVGRASVVTAAPLKRWGCCCPCHFDAVHASPPCQAHSSLKARWRDREHPDLVADTRELLLGAGLPYVIENVEGAPLIDPVTICGSSLGLDVRRHRLFETNWPLMSPPCAHGQQAPRFEVWEHGKWRLSPTVPVYGMGGRKAVEHWPAALGIDWMTRREMAQAIPPAYTELIGHQLMNYLRSTMKEAA